MIPSFSAFQSNIEVLYVSRGPFREHFTRIFAFTVYVRTASRESSISRKRGPPRVYRVNQSCRSKGRIGGYPLSGTRFCVGDSEQSSRFDSEQTRREHPTRTLSKREGGTLFFLVEDNEGDIRRVHENRKIEGKGKFQRARERRQTYSVSLRERRDARVKARVI